MSIGALPKQQRQPGKRKPAKKLVVISGGRHSKLPHAVKTSGPTEMNWKVTQMRLARIQDLQSRLSLCHQQLAEEWQALRKDMIHGATVEDGPIQAFLKYSFRLVRDPRSHERKAQMLTTLVVR